MRKVLSPQIIFEYENSPDNEKIVQRMYNRIFDQAKQNVLNRQKKSRNDKLVYLRSSIEKNLTVNTNDRY